MRYFYSLLLILTILLGACSTKETTTNSNTKLNDSNLTLQANQPKDVTPKKYKPAPIDQVEKSLPFKVKLPSWIPEQYNKISNLEVQDWGNKEKIAIEGKILPSNPSITDPAVKGIYSIRIANFKDVASSTIENKEYSKKETLSNNTEMYYSKSDSNITIVWIDKDIEYVVDVITPGATPTAEQEQNVKKIAESMK